MVDFRIRVIVDPAGAERGSRRANAAINSVGDTAQRVQRLVGRLFAFVGIVEGTRRLVQLADTYTNIQNRLATVTSSTAEVVAVTEQLFGVAQRTRTAFESTAEVYTRTALSVRRLGLSQQQVIQFTEALNQSTVLSGATAQEASNALIQLSQGIASGTLRGEELRSVLEQLPVAADVIAESLGVTRGELRELGAEGQISAEQVVTAFLEASDSLRERFAETVPTIGRAFQQLQNSLVRSIGALDQASGGSRQLALFLQFLADNIDALIRSVILLGNVLLVGLVGRAIPATIVALRALGVAIATNPIGAIATVLTLAVAAFITFSDQLQLTAGSAATVLDFIIVLFEDLGNAIATGVQFIAAQLGAINEATGRVDFGELLRSAARIVDQVIGVFRGLARSVEATFRSFPVTVADLIITGLNFALTQVDSFINSIIEALNRIPGVAINALDIQPLVNPAAGTGAAIGQAFSDGFRSAVEEGNAVQAIENRINRAEQRAQERLRVQRQQQLELERARGGLSVGGERQTTVRREFERELEQLRERIRLTHLSNDARAIENEVIRLRTSLNGQLSESEAAVARTLIETVIAAEQQRDLLDEIRGPQEEYIQRQRTLNELLAQGRITQDEFNQSLRDAQIALLEGQDPTTFFEGFRNQLQLLVLESENAFSRLGTTLGEIFGPGGTLQQGLGDAIAQSLIFGRNFEDSLRRIGQQILSQIVGSLVQVGLQIGLTALLGRTLGSQAVAASSAQAATTAAAWAPAAAFASLATLGANAAPAIAAIAGTTALTTTLAAVTSGIGAFQQGGLVPGGRQLIQVNESGEEFVMRSSAVQRIGLPTLQALNEGRAVPSGGGRGGSAAISIAEGAIQITALPGQSPADLANAFGDELERRIDERITTQQRFGGSLYGTGA